MLVRSNFDSNSNSNCNWSGAYNPVQTDYTSRINRTQHNTTELYPKTITVLLLHRLVDLEDRLDRFPRRRIPLDPKSPLGDLVSDVDLRVVSYFPHVKVLRQVPGGSVHLDKVDLVLDGVHLAVPRRQPQLQRRSEFPSQVLRSKLPFGVLEDEPLLGQNGFVWLRSGRHGDLSHEPKRVGIGFVVERAVAVDVANRFLAVLLDNGVEGVGCLPEGFFAAAGMARDAADLGSGR
mmetsp:Transcript_15965/g.44159  ORF Transcript_15965/g.44159 Transcript_15965/m.44159 type:complete len:234 (+) Transcript_15965:244-945(+)